jgi:hypothetical protein
MGSFYRGNGLSARNAHDFDHVVKNKIMNSERGTMVLSYDLPLIPLGNCLKRSPPKKPEREKRARPDKRAAGKGGETGIDRRTQWVSRSDFPEGSGVQRERK